MQAAPGQPTGTSKLCLSCHDGTIALGAVASRAAPVGLFGRVTGRPNLGRDLSDDHPISFLYDATLAAADGELLPPGGLTDFVRLDQNQEVQCTSCHDAHNDDYGDFLRVDGQYSNLCTSCHDKPGWVGSSHNSSTASYQGGGIDPWPETDWDTVAANGCSNCHTMHAAGHPETLLRFPLEEENCLVCHDGSLAATDIAGEITKSTRHAVDSYLGTHQSEEDPLTMPRHVECYDCHNPHAAVDWTGTPPDVGGSLNGAPGVSLAGAPLEVARDQYEVCLRCHGDNPGEPLPGIERQDSEPNLRFKIDPANPSYHPIAAQGASSDVPSLLSPWSPTSFVYCTDCHASDNGPGAGGSGPAGPHGSRWPYLLERNYSTQSGTLESDAAYALCYKCHDRSSILNDRSFPGHDKHIRGSAAPCSICHDPHGVSPGLGVPGSGTHLINFDVSIVTPDPVSGLLEFEDLGTNQSRCYLSCHGKDHSPLGY
jgi:predicted CXXCH cytochrome family protein